MENGKNSPEINQKAAAQLKQNWQWFLALGISLVVLGMLAIFFSLASTLFSVVYIGTVMIVAGVFEGIKSFKINKWGYFLLHVLLSIVYVLAGCFIIFHPMVNAVSLTLLLAIFFVITGLARIFFAFTHHVPHQMWLAFNGLLNVLLGILVWSQWPESGLWVIGTFVGIDVLFTGWTWIMLSLAAKNYPANHAQ